MTIVVSVLVALLLWPLMLALVGAVTFLAGATVLRGRLSEFKGPAARCKEMFSSAGGSPACACQSAQTPGGGSES